jgi:hypothetical protein
MSEPSVPASSPGFRAYVEKHDILFTLLGGLIILVGFFVKDGIRERSKEEASAIKGS